MDAEHEALAFMLQCPAWDGLYKQTLTERMRSLYLEMETGEASERKILDNLAQIKALKWAIRWPEQEIETAREEMRRKQEEIDAENRTDARVMYGHSLGADHQGGSE